MQSKMEISHRTKQTIGEQWNWNKADWDKGKVIVKRLVTILPAKRWEFISKKSLKQDLDHHDQSIANVTLDNENVVFKVIKMACFSEDREAACHCIDSSASPCVIPHTLMLPLIKPYRHRGSAGESKLPEKKRGGL